MGLWTEWQAARERRRRVESYVGRMLREPDDAIVRLLEAGAGGVVARRELRFALLAIGLIVAERDALDDQTAADVSHQLQPLLAAEAKRDPEVGRLWPERWRAYSAALVRRGSPEAPAMRLARVLLEGVGMAEPAPAQLESVTQFVLENRAALNEALRAVFGAASLPEDVRPSALRSS
jgi:hypothetical protein